MTEELVREGRHVTLFALDATVDFTMQRRAGAIGVKVVRRSGKIDVVIES